MTAPLEALDGMAPIGLDELMACAMLQTRIDRKYLLPAAVLHTLLDRLPPGTRVLEIGGARRFAYRSLYFDTPDLRSYHLTAHRHRRRFKIRTRVYEESAECWLEVKTCGPRGSTVKQRLPYDPHQYATVEPGREFVDGVLADRRVAGEPRRLRLAPVLGTRYHRTTLYLPDTDSRVTIDTGLLWRDGDHELLLPGMAVVETKTGSTASQVDRLLWRHHCRPRRISKYATGLAALRPQLPAGPWRRTLRRDFAGAVRRAAPPAGVRFAGIPVPAAGEPVASAVLT
ncbi:polyphosphate polymerase domain-containing protein [Streptomyces sp. YIM 98790]|uniref:polyphosphate polymerase domain-containing protein n=1 Tax=Streptomyces sp. YIM 98790 TaxID=2689077 RepID=UPI001A9F7BCC|nr:polyphosphate polymerase domain-containing protein [Streptomyces sp. YIM 98790]